LRILVLPALRGFFQTTVPFVRSTHHRNRSLPSATLRKMLSPQMIGVAPVQLGIASFHVMFSWLLQRTGRFVSLLTPFMLGPRHWGQLSARTMPTGTNKTTNDRRINLRTVFTLLNGNGAIVEHSSEKEKPEIPCWL